MNLRRQGSVRRGLGEWLVQRLSALYLAGFLVWLVVDFSTFADYPAWKAWFGGNAVRLVFALFFLNLWVHAWVGLRSVFLDYLKPFWLRFITQSLAALALLALAFWAAQILLLEAGR